MESAAEDKKSEEYFLKLRHSAARVLAEAVKDLFPSTKLTIGPPIEDGFYYDFASDHKFTPEDLIAIENQMLKNLEQVSNYEGREVSREEAKRFWAEKGETFKVEIIDDLPSDAAITFYKHRNFTDLCRGNHLDSTADIKHFRLPQSLHKTLRNSAKSR